MKTDLVVFGEASLFLKCVNSYLSFGGVRRRLIFEMG